MADTLGSLCDKLTIVKLKQYHSANKEKLVSLKQQEEQLTSEIQEYILDAVRGVIPVNRLTFKANKVYRSQNSELKDIDGTIGTVFGKLAEINCMLWHEQEKIYEFEKVPATEKDEVVRRIAILNLERTNCIDKIDATLVKLLI